MDAYALIALRERREFNIDPITFEARAAGSALPVNDPAKER
jgi:hypothetical protein